jgi:phosphate-selective porin
MDSTGCDNPMASLVAVIGSATWLQLMLVLLVSAAAVSAGAAATAGLQIVTATDSGYPKIHL